MDKGQDQGSYSTEEIWDNILDECDGGEAELIEHIKDSCGEIEKPIFREQIQIPGVCDDTLTVDLIWKNKKVMLFLADGADDYEKAKPSGWKCFCTAEMFEPRDLIETIEV